MKAEPIPYSFQELFNRVKEEKNEDQSLSLLEEAMSNANKVPFDSKFTTVKTPIGELLAKQSGEKLIEDNVFSSTLKDKKAQQALYDALKNTAERLTHFIDLAADCANKIDGLEKINKKEFNFKTNDDYSFSYRFEEDMRGDKAHYSLITPDKLQIKVAKATSCFNSPLAYLNINTVNTKGETKQPTFSATFPYGFPASSLLSLSIDGEFSQELISAVETNDVGTHNAKYVWS